MVDFEPKGSPRGFAIKNKIPSSEQLGNLVNLSYKISNTLLQTLDALSSLYQLITGGIFVFNLKP